MLGYSRAVLAKLEILVTPGLVKYSGGISEKRVPFSKTSSVLTSSLEVSIPSMTKLSLIQEFNPRTVWHTLLLVG